MPSVPTSGAQRCTRHPDRDGGRNCTRCGRPACGECLVQASVGSQCVDCVKSGRPPVGERVKRWNATRLDMLTKVFVVANIAVFVYLVVRDPRSLSGGGRGAFDLAIGRIFIANGEYWRFITAGFIHYGLIHLAFNSYALWNIGPMLERVTTRPHFIALYMASLVAGNAGALIEGEGLAGGASGAVFGLFGAAAVALRHRGINPFQTNVGTMIIMNLVLTFAVNGISIGGHIGGLIGGAICGWALTAPRGRELPAVVQWAIPAAVVVVSVVVGIAVSG